MHLSTWNSIDANTRTNGESTETITNDIETNLKHNKNHILSLTVKGMEVTVLRMPSGRFKHFM